MLILDGEIASTLARIVLSNYYQVDTLRLTPFEIDTIRHAIYALDPKAKIYLFGSRVDDTKRGGDIDLLVLSKRLQNEDKSKIRVPLYTALGEQKIDVMIAKDTKQPFVRVALETAVRL